MLEILRSDRFGDGRVAHGFTTRTGGVSEGPYASLNLSWSRGDDKAHVAENRARVSKAFEGAGLVFVNQVHGKTVWRVDHAPESGTMGEGDALITDQPGLALCAQTADCTPVLLFDPEHGAIAAIHAGWRGIIAEIIPATVSAMKAAYGTRAARLQAVIGPAIKPHNYRVGPEVLEQFEALFGDLDAQMALPRDEAGGAGLNVSEAARRQLVRTGVDEVDIAWLQHCTYDQKDRFHSCRRAAHDGHGGHFGGQCGVIVLTAG